MADLMHRLGPFKVTVLSFVALFVLIAGYSNFTGLNSTDPVRVGDEDILKSLTLQTDSLGVAGDTFMIFTPQRAITIKTIDIHVGTEFIGVTLNDTADAEVRIQQGANVVSAYMDSGSTYQNTNPSDVTFNAVACTVEVQDQRDGEVADGTGGIGVDIIVWYTDS